MGDSPSVIHTYNFPLGGPNWLECEYRKVSEGYRWVFKHGGEMTAGKWPSILARGLSRVARFGGATRMVYSVGRHSLLMARYLKRQGYNPQVRLLALIHDASECLGVGDMNTYLKKQIGVTIRGYEDALTDALLHDLSVFLLIGEVERGVVHMTDKMFGETEARLLDMQNGKPWVAAADTPVYAFLEQDGVYDTNAWQTEMDWLGEFDRVMNELIGRQICDVLDD